MRRIVFALLFSFSMMNLGCGSDNVDLNDPKQVEVVPAGVPEKSAEMRS